MASPLLNILLAQAEPFNKTVISTYILFTQVSQQPSSLPDELKQTALCMIIVTIIYHMSG